MHIHVTEFLVGRTMDSEKVTYFNLDHDVNKIY